MAVFHEHPRILKNEEIRELWRPTSEETIKVLQDTLNEAIQQKCQSAAAPLLELDSILLTPDEAMIAGFVEIAHNDYDDKNNNLADRYETMKQVCIDTAEVCLGGDLTSRPKQLIHITLGRVLYVPTCSCRGTHDDSSSVESSSPAEDQISRNKSMTW
jgi:hypothetical protein